MHAFEFLKKPDGHPVVPLYVLAGDEAFLVRGSLQAILRAALDEDARSHAVTRFAGSQASLANVLDELATLPFLSRRRVVIVEDADSFVTANRGGLERYAVHPSSTGILILTVKSWPATTNLAKQVAQIGLTIECKGPAEARGPRAGAGADLSTWLKGYAQSRGARLDPDAAALLIELVGRDVSLLANEVEKLATYVAPRTSIARADVLAMVAGGRVETIWRALDVAMEGKGAEALEMLDQLLATGEEPLRLAGGIAASLLKLHHAGQLRKLRTPAQEACAQAGIPAFAIEKSIRHHAHLGPRRVGRLPRTLLELDLDLKGASALPPRLIFERFFCRLSQPRTD